MLCDPIWGHAQKCRGLLDMREAGAQRYQLDEDLEKGKSHDLDYLGTEDMWQLIHIHYGKIYTVFNFNIAFHGIMWYSAYCMVFYL